MRKEQKSKYLEIDETVKGRGKTEEETINSRKVTRIYEHNNTSCDNEEINTKIVRGKQNAKNVLSVLRLI